MVDPNISSLSVIRCLFLFMFLRRLEICKFVIIYRVFAEVIANSFFIDLLREVKYSFEFYAWLRIWLLFSSKFMVCHTSFLLGDLSRKLIE